MTATAVSWKYANALIDTAEPVAAVRWTIPFLDVFKRKSGGLWVGGSVVLSPDEIAFVPNAVNAAVHDGDTSRRLPLVRVSEVTDRFGWFTRIVDVRTDAGDTLTFRCFGAPAFAQEIRGAVSAVRI